MENKIISLNEVLEIGNRYKNGDMTYDELKAWGDTILIRTYMPIREKIERITKILFDETYSEDIIERFLELEINKFWFLLVGYTDIQIDEETDLLTEDNYNLAFGLLGDWLLNFVKLDYDRSMELFDSIYNYLNVEDLRQSFNNLAGTDFSKMMESNQSLLEFFSQDREGMDKLLKLATLNQSRDLEIWNKLESILKDAQSNNK